ncbi:glycosyltransferase family 39 protein [Palaeococcus pacificus]|nr:glycosyltransferase family 39 protein [Palaeococcus pacificus]
MGFISVYYLFTRLYGIAGYMNEYMDYDEGTYLMIARLINQGYLPYRDIYAVHPPLYYYMLALWLRVFGDSYVVGRALSLLLGMGSIIIAYLVGKEVRDWKLGVSFMALITMDPLLVHMNSLVYHETSIEFFTLLSLYFAVKYFKSKNMRYAYASLFVAGLGSTSKFTILPYLLALYITIVFSLDKKLWECLKRASDILLTRKQGLAIGLAYMAMILLVISAIMLYPSKLARLFFIVPGIHPITVVGQKFAVALIIIFWGIFTIYLFKVIYIKKLYESLMILLKNWKIEFKLALAVLTPKLLVELPLGFLVSRDYLNQTYFAQGGRYSPIINLFSLISDFLGALRNGNPEFLYYYTPILVLIFLYFLATSLETSVKLNQYLKGLALTNFFVYFFIAPILPNMRFMYPMALVLYLLLLDGLLGVSMPKKKIMTGALMAVMLLATVDFGIVVNYPKGELKLGWAIHSKDLRNDLGAYIKGNGIQQEVYFSVNPMNAYYLNLSIHPYTLDNFGLFYLAYQDAGSLMETLKKNNVSRIILSKWMYVIKSSDKLLKENYGAIEKEALINFTLEFAESYSTGDVIELYKIGANIQNLSITSSKGMLSLAVNGEKIANIYIADGNIKFNTKTKVSLKNGSYIVEQSSENATIRYVLDLKNDEATIVIPEEMALVINFESDAVLIKDGGIIKCNESVKGPVTIATPKFVLRIVGSNITLIDTGKLRITGFIVKITKI